MNNKKLLVAVLGNRNSGKSTTWQKMFNDSNIRTKQKSLRKLHFNNCEYANVFLINGSPQERKRDVEDIIEVGFDPDVVLCSIQYKHEALDTLKYFYNKGYFMYIHWLNPGRHDSTPYNDNLNLIPEILDMNSIIGKRNGKVDPTERVEEMKRFIYDFTKKENLVKKLTSVN